MHSEKTETRFFHHNIKNCFIYFLLSPVYLCPRPHLFANFNGVLILHTHSFKKKKIHPNSKYCCVTQQNKNSYILFFWIFNTHAYTHTHTKLSQINWPFIILKHNIIDLNVAPLSHYNSCHVTFVLCGFSEDWWRNNYHCVVLMFQYYMRLYIKWSNIAIYA